MPKKRGLEFHFTAPPADAPFASFVAPLNRDKETNEQIKRRILREAYFTRQKDIAKSKGKA